MKGETWKEANLESSVGVHRKIENSSKILINQGKSIKCQEDFEGFKNSLADLHVEETINIQPIQLMETISNDIDHLVMDSCLVMDFLNKPAPSDCDFTVPRNASKQIDYYFDKPQVTTKSLIKDGQDIIEYLNLNRYSRDIDSDLHDFDLSLLEDEFEEAKKDLNVDRLIGAVNRLRMLQSHLK